MTINDAGKRRLRSRDAQGSRLKGKEGLCRRTLGKAAGGWHCPPKQGQSDKRGFTQRDRAAD